MAEPRTVTFRVVEGNRPSVTVPLGAGPPQWSGPEPIWSEETREGRKSLVFYDGAGLRRIRLPVLFDGWRDGRHIDAQVDALERLTGVDEALDRPPAVQLVGPVRDWSMRFQVGSVEYGDAVVGDDGFRLRLEATVELVEFVEADLLVRSSLRKAKAERGQQGTRRTTYIVGRNESLTGIAKRLLGDPSRAREIQSLNLERYPGLRDYRHVKQLAGKTLRMPPHRR